MDFVEVTIGSVTCNGYCLIRVVGWGLGMLALCAFFWLWGERIFVGEKDE